ncbi:MAG: hypothetical protein IJ213_03700 [Bacteroidales bacterium]|nr:hypothetical protein [Bacteroidales bacterium]
MESKQKERIIDEISQCLQEEIIDNCDDLFDIQIYNCATDIFHMLSDATFVASSFAIIAERTGIINYLKEKGIEADEKYLDNFFKRIEKIYKQVFSNK